jgi:hypothetical protein
MKRHTGMMRVFVVLVALTALAACGASSAVSTSPTTAPAATTTTRAVKAVIPESSGVPLRTALRAWDSFPVAASPRPLVMTSDVVSAPALGFPSVETKEAFLTGLFVAPGPLPAGPAEADGYRVLSATDALAVMRAEGSPAAGAPYVPAPLHITNVGFDRAAFATDRGKRTLPAWLFTFEGIQDPAAVLAVAPEDRFPLPNDLAAGTSVGARVADDGRTATISFVGAEEGTGPCSAEYTVDQLASDTAIAVIVREIRHQDPPAGVGCTDVGYSRHVKITFEKPLGNRVLVDAKSKGPVTISG